jgi:hypothetical protein
MTNETLRMQMLAGIITEGEYKAKLQESLWDRIKDTPKAWIARIKGGTPAIIASAFSDGGIKIGVPVYFYDGGSLNKMTIKSIDYNTGISDIIYEKSSDGGGKFDIDEKESLETKLGLDQDLSKLSTKTPEEQKTWYDKTVESIKDSFSTKDVSYRIEDLKPDTPKEKPEWKSNKYIDTPSISLEKQREYSQFAKVAENKKKKSLKESMIGGIVGIGAINQIPPRAKADYEMAFEHFLGERYETKFENREQDPHTMNEADEAAAVGKKVEAAAEDKLEATVDNLSDEQKAQLRAELAKAGITANSKIEDVAGKLDESLFEGEGDTKQKVASALGAIGGGLMKSMLVPLIPLIVGHVTGTGFGGGLAITAGTAGALIALAKVLSGGKSMEEGKEVEESSLYENNPLKGDPGHMTKYRIGVISTLISDAEKDLIKYKELSFFTPELIEKMKGTIERLKSTLEDLKAQYEEEIKAFSNDGMNKNKKIDDQTYRDQMAAIQGGYY